MKYTKKTLKNGLRIISVPMKDSETAIAMVLVEAGSDYEIKSNNGLSHFLEHMCFKGTQKRTGDDIKYELDSLGSDSNAFTGNEYTGYYAKANHLKIDKILDLVSDIYLNPTFPEKDIDIEKGVIIEEINMNEDLPQRKVWDIWMKLLYSNQSAGQTIIGPKENIKKIKQIDFKKYHQEHYIPNKTVIVVAGKINENKIIELIKQKFEKIPKAKTSKKIKTIENQLKPQINIFEKKTDQTHLILGFRAFSLFDKRNKFLSLAAVILGKGFSSRLFTKMRDELGMCYYTRADVDSFTDHGFFAVSAGVGNARFEEAVKVIMEEFKKIRDIKISEKELQKAKDFLLGKLATSLETSDAWAMYYGFQELHHEKIETPEDIVKKINKITAKDIEKVLKQIFDISKFNLVAVGPQKITPSLKKLLKI
jgi:predicted Zn-dependent peptidase